MFKGFIPSIIWTVVIIVLSIIPSQTLNEFSWSDMWNIDKLGHLVFYGIHTLLLLYAMSGDFHKKRLANQWIKAPFLTILLGFCMEFNC